MKKTVSLILCALVIAGTACFMTLEFPDLWVWTLFGVGERTRSIPWFPFLWKSHVAFTSFLPIPCCLAGYFLMRRNKEEIRYPGAAFIFWLNLAVIVFFGSFLLWGALTDKLPF